MRDFYDMLPGSRRSQISANTLEQDQNVTQVEKVVFSLNLAINWHHSRIDYDSRAM